MVVVAAAAVGGQQVPTPLPRVVPRSGHNSL